jgi:ribosome biogenesis SPOUT family RNA methylase Rps3
LLDLRGEKLLTPEDAGQFDVFVFGGILGDHPPRDRTSALRTQDVQMRNLGSLQFSTDSAVLVTKLIIEK